MPNLTKEELWRQLKQGFVAPVYVLCGEETYLRDSAAAQIIRHAFNENDLREFNESECSFNVRGTIETAIAAADQLPIMSGRRVVKITDVRIGATALRDTLREEREDQIAAYLDNPATSTVMIFIADELNGNRKITRLLKKHAAIVEFQRLTDADLMRWIRKSVDEADSEIDDLSIRRLIDLVGTDLRRLSNEIQKLSAAALTSRRITRELIEELSTNSSQLDNWALTAAIVSGRPSRALAVLKKVLDDGAEPVALLGLLSYNFRRLLIAKEMMS